MKQFNFLSKSSSQSCGHSSVTLAMTVGSPSAHRRGTMLKLISVLVLILTFGVGNVWATEYTYNSFTTSFVKGTTNGTGISNQVSTNGMSTIASSGATNFASQTNSNCYYNSSGAGIRISKSAAGGNITLTLSNALKDSTIYAIVLYASKVSGNNAAKLDVTPTGPVVNGYTTVTNIGNSTLPAYSTSAHATTSLNTYKLDTIKVKGKKINTLNFASAKAGYTMLHAITIITQTEKAAPAPSYTITAQSSNNSYGSVSLSGSVITATPAENCRIASTAYNVTSGTATVERGTGANINKFTVTPSSDCTVRINFEQIPSHTVTWSANGSTTSESYQEGAAIEFPESATGCTGGTFRGWTASPIDGTSDDAPSYVTSANMGNADVTYYAVFADMTTGVGDWEKCTSSTIDEGDYLIVSGSYMMTNTLNSSRFNRTSITVSDGVISYDAKNDWTAYIWHIKETSTSGIFTIKNGNNYVVGTGTKSQADLVSSPTDNKELFAITYQSTHETYKIENQYNKEAEVNYLLRDGGSYFACYADGSYPMLFKRGNGYSNFRTSCCTPLAQVNGSDIVSQTPTSVQLSWNAVEGAEKYQVKVPGSTSHNDWTDATSGVTVTGLACGTAYTAHFRAIDTNGSHCAEGPESIKEIPAKSWTVTTTGVTNATPNEAWPTTTCTGFSTTVTAAPGYDLPSTITVNGANCTWSQGTGALAVSNVEGDVSITLTPTVHTYSITYKDQGGENFSGTQTDAPTSHTYGTATTLKIPTKANHSFGGWFTSVGCTIGAVGDAESATLGATDYTADIVLYAKWVANQHTLTYSEGDAESGSVPAEPTLYDHGHKVTILGNTGELAKEHYVFETWTDGENEYGEGDNFNIYDDVTLSPKWACNEYVNVSKGTPTNGSFELSATGSRYTCEGDEIITVTPSANTGYAFSAIEVTGVAGAINQTAKTVTYAQYAHGASTINVTFAPVVSAITWDLNYQGAPTASSTDYTYAGEALELPAPTRTGYDFVGWFTDPTDGSQIDNVGGSNKPYAATTYYAHWTINNYTVTWKVAGNDYTMGVSASNNNANYNTTVSAPTAPAASLLGEQGCADTFMGWSKKNGGHDAKAASFYDDLFTTTSPAITENTTFYAVFAKAENGTTNVIFDPSNVSETPETGSNTKIWRHNSGVQMQLYGSSSRYTGGNPNTWTMSHSSGSKTVITSPTNITQIVTKSVYQYRSGNKTYTDYVKKASAGTLSPTSFTSGDADEDGNVTQTISNINAKSITIQDNSSSTGDQARVVLLTVTYSTTSYSDYVTECAPLTCSVPQSLASTPGKNEATLSWSAPEVGTASKYQYAVWAVGADEPTSGYSETTNLTATVSGLMSDTEYNWKVRTVCTGTDGESEFAKSTFTTGSVDLTFSVPTGVSSVTASTSASALPSAGVPDACAGCWSFAGWSSDANATSVEYAAGGTYKFDGDKTLYAVYGKGNNTYKLIDDVTDLTANEYYVVTYNIENGKADAMTNEVVESDYVSSSSETVESLYINNPSSDAIWKLTGSSSAWRLQNIASSKYMDLSDYNAAPIAVSTTDNLNITLYDAETKRFNIGSVNTPANFLQMYNSGWGVDNDHDGYYSAYLYKRQMGSLTTAPDCSGHTVEWYVAGAKVRTDEGVSSCDGVASLPSVDVADVRCKTEGTTFMGWSETNVGVTPTSDADEIAALNLFTDAADAPAITADKQFYAVFAEGSVTGTESKTIKYSVATTSTLTSTGTSPEGTSATYSQTYNTACQMTKDNSATLTLKDWGTTRITKLVLSMKSNSSSGNGKLRYSIDGGTNYSYLVGSANSGVGFNQAAWNGDWSTSYVDITKDELAITGTNANDIIIQIEATANSLFCESYEITYDVPVYSYADYFTECCPQKTITLSGVDDEVGKHFESDKEEACEGETVTLTKTEEGFFNFGGWTVYKTGDKNTTVTVTNNQFEMPDYAVTVEAEWNPKNYKATVASEDNNKGTVSVIGGSIDGDDFQVAYGSPLTLTATPVNDDHYFQNWTVTPDIPELDLTQNPLVITMPGNNIDVTANFGTVADPPALTLETNEAYTLTATLANGDPIANMGAIRSGTALKVSYVLNGQNEKTGWTLTPATTYGESENYITFNMPSEDLRVALAVRPYYTLGLSAENGSISSVSINSEAQTPTTTSYNVHAGEIVEVVATPTNDTYKFKEWVKTGDAATYSDASTTATLKVGTENMTLKAVFEAKATYNLTLNALGRTQEVIPALEGTDVASLLEDKNAVTLKGYHFEGWSETEDGEAISGDDALKLNGDKTVYAVYSAEAYYQKVTSTDDITDGQYQIVYEDGEVAFNGGLTTLDAENNTIDVTINNGKIDITNATTAAEFTINKTAGTIKSASGQYIGQTSDANGLSDDAESEYTNTLSIEEDGNADIVSSGGAHLRYNSASNQLRFRYYKSSSYTGQKAIQLYKKVAPGANESNPTTVVANNEVLVIDEDATLNNLTIEAGGKVETTNELTVINNLTIESEAGKSGQVSNAGKVHANNVYMDVTFYKTATELDATSANQWYMISAPFDVNLNGGFFQTDGTPMVFTVAAAPNSFDLFEYDGSKRASTGKTGWKRASGKMKAGVAYLIGFEAGQSTTIRLKAANTTMTDKDAITLNTYTSTIGTTDENEKNSNWNGVANPNLHYISINKDAQTYDNDARSYNPSTSGSTSYVVGTAFFIHGDGNASIENIIQGDLRAPRRATEVQPIEFCVRLQQENASWANRMYIRASEEASAHYEAGRDLETMNGTNGNNALLWSNNYGMRLAIEEAPIVNDKASYALSLYAPANGTYRIETPTESENADLYLTKDGHVIWNLSMNGYEVELTKGTTEGYGLLLVRKAPSVATGVDEPTSDSSLKGRATKVVIDEHVYILRGGQMYDVTGKAVK